jgi:hypothetical protein
MDESIHNGEDVLIDRLVDGELSADQRRELLASLESQPGGWRRCALAFVEAQVMRQELRRFVCSSDSHKDQSAAHTVQVSASEKTLAPRTEHAPRRRAGIWLAAAASLLIAFGLGRHLAPKNSPAIGRNDAANPQIADDAPPAAPSGDAVTLVVNDERGVPHRLQVPLVEGRRLGAQFADTPRWSESSELTRQLNEQGLGLTARRRYAPMFFEQQNHLVPMVVPVDDAVVTPVNRPVF